MRVEHFRYKREIQLVNLDGETIRIVRLKNNNIGLDAPGWKVLITERSRPPVRIPHLDAPDEVLD